VLTRDDVTLLVRFSWESTVLGQKSEEQYDFGSRSLLLLNKLSASWMAARPAAQAWHLWSGDWMRGRGRGAGDDWENDRGFAWVRQSSMQEKHWIVVHPYGRDVTEALREAPPECFVPEPLASLHFIYFTSVEEAKAAVDLVFVMRGRMFVGDYIKAYGGPR
jgi:hypothetical protein